jgi:hypothetical protein
MWPEFRSRQLGNRLRDKAHLGAKTTKCGVGLITFMTCANHTGMLSSGVVLPESSIITNNTGIESRPNWAIVEAIVPRAMPSAATVNT